MIRLLFIFSFLLSGTGINAQHPEPVYSFARVHKPLPWYKEQAAAWRKVLDKDAKNAQAWYYYYYTQRNLRFRDSDDNRTAAEKEQAITALIAEMEKHIPETYEYNLIKYMSGGLDSKYDSYLQRAVALGPDRAEHLDFLINKGELSRDVKARNLNAMKKFQAGNISTGMLYYNYNVLMGLAPNAILLTAGDNDTYPAWVLQAQGIRTDVTVINLSLIEIDDYREKLLKELNASPLPLPSWDHHEARNMARKDFKNKLLTTLSGRKAGGPVYIGLTAAGEGFEDTVEENLYLTGLAYLYTAKSVDDIALLKKNFEQEYALDYIDKPLYQDISGELVRMVNGNYVVPMLKLFDHYKTAGESGKAEWMKKKLLAVSEGSPQESEVKKHLAAN
ncbi:MAG: hypothetical protein EOP49_14670 [Sphingobacteriales bacterium]|nr:MAG: hypothetical protein EOP49_14670 [Sphingobacteriales bacterium]